MKQYSIITIVLEIMCFMFPILLVVVFKITAYLNKNLSILNWGLFNIPKPCFFVNLSLESKVISWSLLKKNLTWTRIITCCSSILWSLFWKLILLYFFKDENVFNFFFICYILHMPFFVFICKTYITYLFQKYIPNKKNFLGLPIKVYKSKKVQITIIKNRKGKP